MTLPELLIAVSIAMILGFLAIPVASKLVDNVRGDLASNDLMLAIKNARSEAVSRNHVVRVCPSSDGLNCTQENRWEHGWITYLDETGSESRTPGDRILQVKHARKGVNITKNGTGRTIKFNVDGTISQNFSFFVCADGGHRPLGRVVVTQTGRVRMASNVLNCLADG